MPERGARAEQPFLERDAELQQIEDALKAATGGAGSVVLAAGHAGVGKTRLLDVAADRARALGFSVLTARAAETEQDFSFGVVLQLLQRAVMTLDPKEREDVLSGAAAPARSLLEGSEVTGPQAPGSAATLSHGLYWVVANLAERGPLVLSVDDAHWADQSSMRFISYLLNRLDGLAASVLLARRLGERGPAVDMLEAIARSQNSSVVSVRPLSDQAVSTIVRAKYTASADDAFCEACARAVSGNPLYLQELLAGLRIRGTPANAAGADDVLTMDLGSIQWSVRTRLSRAGAEGTKLAEVASLDDGGLPLHLAARVAELQPPAAAAAAATLAAAEILTPDDPLRFVHPLVRNAVYTGLDERKRRALHRDAARLLLDEEAEAERTAAHVQLGEKRHEDWAVEVLLAAASSAIERGAPKTAVSHLRAALEEDPPPDIRAMILAQLGLAGLAAGDADAADLVRDAAKASTTVSMRARYLIMAAHTMFHVGRYQETIELVRWVASLEVDEDVRVAVVGLAAGISNVLGVVEPRSIEQLSKICDLIAARPDAPATLAERMILAARAGLLSLSGELAGDVAHGFATRALSGIRGEEITGPMFPGPMALWLTDDYISAGAALDSSIEASTRRGFLHDLTSGLTHRSELHYRIGNVHNAIADAEAALEGARQGIHGIEPIASAMLGLSLLDAGDVSGAARALGYAKLERWSGLNHLALLHEARGHLRLARGRSREALESYAAAGEIVRGARAGNPAFCAWRSGAALAHRALGDRDEATDLAGEEVALAKDFGAPRAIGIALRAQGLIEGGDEGLDALRQAVDVLGPSGARLEYARASTDLGAALRRMGFKADAQEHLRTGLDVAGECGADGLAARAREELVAAGGRPRRQRLRGMDALTPQERRIAELVTGGLSNREIAQGMFLTRKTIETHLTNVYAKLGIRSRDELPAILEANRTIAS